MGRSAVIVTPVAVKASRLNCPPKYLRTLRFNFWRASHGSNSLSPIRLRTRLKNKLHRAIYLDLAYYKDGLGLVRQCSYYDRRYQQRAVPVTPPTLVSCFFPYTKAGILSLVNQELCCDFTHILVTEGIDLDSNTTPLCGAI